MTGPGGRSDTQPQVGAAGWPGRVWSAISRIFSGVPAEGHDGTRADGALFDGQRFEPQLFASDADGTAFATRMSNEISRHPTRLAAACLASVLGPAMVAHAGSLGLSPASPAGATAEAVVDESPVAAPAPGASPAWEAAARVAAGTCPGLPATVLVAIARVESGLGVQSWASSAGAEGPMQFLPRTWAAYGSDGDGDGRADVHNSADALHGAARLLCANGAGEGRLHSALWNYNHSDDYVAQVLAVARVGSGSD